MQHQCSVSSAAQSRNSRIDKSARTAARGGEDRERTNGPRGSLVIKVETLASRKSRAAEASVAVSAQRRDAG
jgi:hypothetical protein